MRHKMLILLSIIAYGTSYSQLMINPDQSLYQFTMKSITGEPVSLETYKGKVLLIVNTASECGFTPQYEFLQSLWEQYRDSGLVILGFPANQFGSQEPGSNEEIRGFCTKNFGVSFPLFEKIIVKGEGIHPLYQYLTQKSLNGVVESEVKWNFQKFLVSRQGKVIEVFPPKTKPTDPQIINAIKTELAKPE